MEKIYQTGVSNIGPLEQGLFVLAGVIGMMVAGILLVHLDSIHAAPSWRLTLFFPLFISALGLMQARARFCTGYAVRGVYRTEAGDLAKSSKEEKKKSRARALKLNLQALAIAVVITFLTLVA